MAPASVNTRIFTLASGNRIETVSVKREDSGQYFETEQELAALAASWPGAQLVEIWNQLPSVQPVTKFTDRKTAVRRIWKAVHVLQTTDHATKRTETAKKVPCTTGVTKAESVIALLRRSTGATLAELMSATGWQAHSVRGFISGQLVKKRHLKVKSFTRDGARVYRLRS